MIELFSASLRWTNLKGPARMAKVPEAGGLRWVWINEPILDPAAASHLAELRWRTLAEELDATSEHGTQGRISLINAAQCWPRDTTVRTKNQRPEGPSGRRSHAWHTGLAPPPSCSTPTDAAR